MRFNVFSSREQRQPTSTRRSSFNSLRISAEKAALAAAVYTLLESLPQSHSGSENIKRLCQTILESTSHLRFIWVGFCEGESELVEPYATAGACTPECADWRLPRGCFNFTGTYSQTSYDNLDEAGDRSSLFAPWRHDADACSASAALAVPMRSERTGLRGLIVFYADEIDYFSHMGVKPFQAFCHLAEVIWKQSTLLQMLTQKAQQDTLTGLMNRRRTMYTLEKAVETAEAAKQPLSVLICRIEGFGKINDLYGWVAADAILAAFAKEMTRQLRPEDKGGRWTGIEFLFVLPDTNAQQVDQLAQGLQDYFLTHPITVKNWWSIRLALAFGSATYSEEFSGLDDLVQQANQNMLNAGGDA